MILRKQMILTVAALMLAGASVSGCANTFHGAGEDIENAGEAIQDANE